MVIDVGVNAIPDASKKSGQRLVGDVDFEAVAKKASAITPVPGGVGPLTRAMLLWNTVLAASGGARGARLTGGGSEEAGPPETGFFVVLAELTTTDSAGKGGRPNRPRSLIPVCWIPRLVATKASSSTRDSAPSRDPPNLVLRPKLRAPVRPSGAGQTSRLRRLTACQLVKTNA